MAKLFLGTFFESFDQYMINLKSKKTDAVLFQFFPGEEHVVVLQEDYEAEERRECMCTTTADTQHPVREHLTRNFSL